MPAYVDLSSIHTPVAGQPAPSSWGLQVRDNFDTLAKPPRCRVTRSTNQNVPHATDTPIIWDAATWDAGYDGASPHWMSGSTDRLFVRRTGRYLVTAMLLLNGTSATGLRHLKVRKNASDSFILLSNMIIGGTWAGGTLAGFLALTSGETVQATAYQDSGVTMQMTMAYGLNLALEWLGPL